jgi:hypothetical protein
VVLCLFVKISSFKVKNTFQILSVLLQEGIMSQFHIGLLTTSRYLQKIVHKNTLSSFKVPYRFSLFLSHSIPCFTQ